MKIRDLTPVATASIGAIPGGWTDVNSKFLVTQPSGTFLIQSLGGTAGTSFLLSPVATDNCLNQQVRVGVPSANYLTKSAVRLCTRWSAANTYFYVQWGNFTQTTNGNTTYTTAFELHRNNGGTDVQASASFTPTTQVQLSGTASVTNASTAVTFSNAQNIANNSFVNFQGDAAWYKVSSGGGSATTAIVLTAVYAGTTNAVAGSLQGSTLSVAVTNGSATVTFSGNVTISTGGFINLNGDAAWYKVSVGVAAGTTITLATTYAGTTNAQTGASTACNASSFVGAFASSSSCIPGHTYEMWFDTYADAAGNAVCIAQLVDTTGTVPFVQSSATATSLAIDSVASGGTIANALFASNQQGIGVSNFASSQVQCTFLRTYNRDIFASAPSPTFVTLAGGNQTVTVTAPNSAAVGHTAWNSTGAPTWSIIQDPVNVTNASFVSHSATNDFTDVVTINPGTVQGTIQLKDSTTNIQPAEGSTALAQQGVSVQVYNASTGATVASLTNSGVTAQYGGATYGPFTFALPAGVGAASNIVVTPSLTTPGNAGSVSYSTDSAGAFPCLSVTLAKGANSVVFYCTPAANTSLVTTSRTLTVATGGAIADGSTTYSGNVLSVGPQSIPALGPTGAPTAQSAGLMLLAPNALFQNVVQWPALTTNSAAYPVTHSLIRSALPGYVPTGAETTLTSPITGGQVVGTYVQPLINAGNNISTTDVTDTFVAGSRIWTPVAMSGTSTAGAPWTITNAAAVTSANLASTSNYFGNNQVVLDTGGQQELMTVTGVTATTFNGTSTKTHTATFSISGNLIQIADTVSTADGQTYYYSVYTADSGTPGTTQATGTCGQVMAQTPAVITGFVGIGDSTMASADPEPIHATAPYQGNVASGTNLSASFSSSTGLVARAQYDEGFLEHIIGRSGGKVLAVSQNLGKNGRASYEWRPDSSAGLLPPMLQACPPSKYPWVMLRIGTNDVLRGSTTFFTDRGITTNYTKAQYYANVKTTIDWCLVQGYKVMVLPILHNGSYPAVQSINDWNYGAVNSLQVLVATYAAGGTATSVVGGSASYTAGSVIMVGKGGMLYQAARSTIGGYVSSVNPGWGTASTPTTYQGMTSDNTHPNQALSQQIGKLDAQEFLNTVYPAYNGNTTSGGSNSRMTIGI